jgi:nucleotide-binding universal stress UspA family protein
MQHEILVPLDGSPLAETILPHAQLLAESTGSALTLLSIVPVLPVTNPMAGALGMDPLDEHDWETDVARAHDYLLGVAARLEADGVRVRAEAIEGVPAPAILDYAARHPAVRTIAMATHGRGGVGRWVFGSVAEQVLHGTPIPLLLVRPQPGPRGPQTPAARPYRTILVPLDGSALAEQALTQATALAAHAGAALLLVAAVPEPDTAVGRPGKETQPRNRAAAARVAEATRLEAYLGRTAANLRAQGAGAGTALPAGPAAEAILHAAETGGADLIVMASHGRSGLARLWLGSVAAKVVQGATRPVFLVRATGPDTR